jgi:hypothetical protein
MTASSEKERISELTTRITNTQAKSATDSQNRNDLAVIVASARDELLRVKATPPAQ